MSIALELTPINVIGMLITIVIFSIWVASPIVVASKMSSNGLSIRKKLSLWCARFGHDFMANSRCTGKLLKECGKWLWLKAKRVSQIMANHPKISLFAVGALAVILVGLLRTDWMLSLLGQTDSGKDLAKATGDKASKGGGLIHFVLALLIVVAGTVTVILTVLGTIFAFSKSRKAGFSIIFLILLVALCCVGYRSDWWQSTWQEVGSKKPTKTPKKEKEYMWLPFTEIPITEKGCPVSCKHECQDGWHVLCIKDRSVWGKTIWWDPRGGQIESKTSDGTRDCNGKLIFSEPSTISPGDPPKENPGNIKVIMVKPHKLPVTVIINVWGEKPNQ
jgi:hypothetical protein